MAKQKYTVQQIIDALAANEGRVAIAAEELGCQAQTIYNYRDRYPTIEQFIQHKREKRLDLAENSLWDLVLAGNLGAVIFFLKTQGKDRGYTERQELTGKDGGPIVTKAYTVVSPDDWPDNPDR